MENKRQQNTGSSSSSSVDFDHLFGLKDSSSSSTSSSGLFGSIFSSPSTGPRRNSSHSAIIGSLKKQGEGSKANFNSKEKGAIYQNEAAEPCYLSSSIYYGGQENYSPRTRSTTESHFKKDGGEDDPNESNSNSASRGNWWQGSLYY